ncbi:MAG: class I SAM-dependent methyltransferase [Proteobacteria bacterium]|nr:class I SAM-dependent methyltransferase [Pseudomonadota bacterium]
MIIRPRSLLAGLRSYVPTLSHFRDMGGSTTSARYCYAVWMRHLVKLSEAGLEKIPATVAELGPGGSLGIIIAALLSGAERGIGLDAVAHADSESNLRVLEEMVELFRCRTSIPGHTEFPQLRPVLLDYAFPAHLLLDETLTQCLAPERITAIRRAIYQKGNLLEYVAPWGNAGSIEPQSIDLLLSQAVLEHVDALETVYACMSRWLRPGALMSHVIDYPCHNISSHWNGQWACGPRYWKLVRGKRPFFINRRPHSTHLQLHVFNGFKPLLVEVRVDETGLPAHRLAPPYRYMDKTNLTTSGSLIISQKTKGKD